MEQIEKDEPQEHITLSDYSNQILIQNKDLTEQLGLSEEATIEQVEQELQEAEEEYSDRKKRNQEVKANQALEKIKLLKRGMELIILTNQKGIKQEDPKIKQLSKEMEEKIQELGFNNYDDIIQEIIDLQEKLQKPIANQVKKKGLEEDLKGCLEVQALHEEIQKILSKNKQPNLNNKQLEEEYTQLLEELGTTLEEIKEEIQGYKDQIQKYSGKNEKREKSAREKLVKYERLHELAQILQKNERNDNPNNKAEQVFDQVDNNQKQEEAKLMDEQTEVALEDYKQQKLEEAIVLKYNMTINNEQSFEKTLNECLFHLLNKIQPNKHAKEISKQDLLELIKDLKRREEIEELGVNKELNDAISDITNQNYEKVFDTLKVLAFNSSLVAFNFLEFIHIMDQVKNTGKTIENKDIILFLGVTGSGKSTTIQYLCGSTMKAMKVQGLNHIEAVDIKNSQLKNIKSSPFAKSETRYITAITKDLKDLNYPVKQEVILVDSPGSGDLESVEVDLANTLGIFNSVRQAKSVRLVLLFGYQNLGNRSDQLKEELKFYSSIIDDLEENLKAITYAFTQVPHNQTDQIESKLKSINDYLNIGEQNNNDLKTFLEDIIRKSFQKKIIIINPLDKEPLQVLLKILDSKKMTSPRDSFKFTMSSKAKISLEKEFNLSQKKIEKSITKNNEYSLALEKFRILKTVTTILEDDRDTKNLYNDVITRTKRIYQNYGDKVKEFIKRHQVVENVIQETEIKEVKNIFKKLNEMKPIKKEFFDDEDIKGTSDFEQEIRSLALKISSNLKEKEIDDRIWDTSLAKIEVFSKEFELCREIEKQTLEYYQLKKLQHLDSYYHSVINEIGRQDFEKISKENSSQSQSSMLFQKLIKAKETLKNQKYQDQLKYAVEQSEKQIIQKFETIYKENILKFIVHEDNNFNLNNDGALQINNYLELLDLFNFNYSYLSQNLKSFFEQQKTILKNTMLQLFNQSLEDFRESLKQENDAKIKLTYHTILSIKNIKALSVDIYSKFYQLSFDIEQQMKHNKEQIEAILHSLKLDNSNDIENKLKILRTSLRKAIQLSKIHDSEELLKQYKEDVQQELDEWKESLMRNKIPPKVSGMFQYDKLEDIFKVHSLLKMIEKCYSVLQQKEDSNLSNNIKDQLDESFSRIEASINQIDSTYAESTIKKSDFELLFKHFLSI